MIVLFDTPAERKSDGSRGLEAFEMKWRKYGKPEISAEGSFLEISWLVKISIPNSETTDYE